MTTFVMRLRRLLAEEYSESDVREILDSLASVLKADLGKELENASHTNVLVLNQLFKQAEGMGLSFSVDTSQLEDHSLISEMKRFEDDAEERRAAEAKMTVRDRPGLATLAKASDGAGHLDLVRRNNELEDEVRQWKARFESLVRPPPLLPPPSWWCHADVRAGPCAAQKQQSLGMAQAHSALGSEREALSSQFEAMSMEQQQAMLEMQRQQEELGAAQAGAGAAVSTPPNPRYSYSSCSCSSLSPRFLELAIPARKQRRVPIRL